MKTRPLPDLGKAERNSGLFLIPIIKWKSEPPCRWEGPSTEVSTGEERGRHHQGLGRREAGESWPGSCTFQSGLPSGRALLSTDSMFEKDTLF